VSDLLAGALQQLTPRERDEIGAWLTCALAAREEPGMEAPTLALGEAIRGPWNLHPLNGARATTLFVYAQYVGRSFLADVARAREVRP
jgi:hypothetical protein